MRLIDIDALTDAIEKTDWYHVNLRWKWVQGALIENAPTVDAVEVVRCKDCKHGEVEDPDFQDVYFCHSGCGWNKEDFYCAYGERRNGNG